MRFTSLLIPLLLAACAGSPPPRVAPPPVAAPPIARPTPPAEEVPNETQAITAVDVSNSIFFASASTELDETGRAALHRHAERLKANTKLRAVLVGYTDDLGSRAYNLAIADKRVQAVYGELRRLGVAPMQMKRSSVGTEKTSKACRSPECRQMMRRVEIDYRD